MCRQSSICEREDSRNDSIGQPDAGGNSRCASHYDRHGKQNIIGFGHAAFPRLCLSYSLCIKMKDALRQKLHGVLLFLFCGVPGLVLVVASSILFLIITSLHEANIRLTALAATTLALGVCLALLGVSKMREWLYSIVLLAFPFSLVVWGLLARQLADSAGPIGFIVGLVLFAALLPLLALNLVTKYYRTHQRDTRRDREIETAQLGGPSNPHSPPAQGADGR